MSIDHLDFPTPPNCICVCHRGAYSPVAAVVRVHKGDTERVLHYCQGCTDSARELAETNRCGVNIEIEDL